MTQEKEVTNKQGGRQERKCDAGLAGVISMNPFL